MKEEPSVTIKVKEEPDAEVKVIVKEEPDVGEPAAKKQKMR